jgi:hypothetical protein
MIQLQKLGYHVQGSKGKNLWTLLVCLIKMERSLNRNEIGCRRLNGRSKEKYPRKQPSDLINVVTSKKGVIVDLEYECAIAGLLSLIKSKKSDFFINLV